MRLNAKLQAAIVELKTKATKDEDGRETYVDLEVLVNHEDAATVWGQDFADLAFSTMRTITDCDGVQHIRFATEKIKPGKRFVFEMHRVVFDEIGSASRFDAQPKLRSVRTLDGLAKVIASLRIKLSPELARLRGVLDDHVGQRVEVSFEPMQGTLELGGKAPTVVTLTRADLDPLTQDGAKLRNVAVVAK